MNYEIYWEIRTIKAKINTKNFLSKFGWKCTVMYCNLLTNKYQKTTYLQGEV